MAKQQTPNTAPLTTPTIKERQSKDVEDLGMVGTYGDIALHGSLLLQDGGDAKPQESNDLDHPLHWTFQCYGPKDKAELHKLVDAKPELMLDVVRTKLVSNARAMSWATVRGSATTADIKITFNGKVTESHRVDLGAVEAMRAAGMTVEIIPRVRKVKPTK